VCARHTRRARPPAHTAAVWEYPLVYRHRCEAAQLRARDCASSQPNHTHTFLTLNFAPFLSLTPSSLKTCQATCPDEFGAYVECLDYHR